MSWRLLIDTSTSPATLRGMPDLPVSLVVNRLAAIASERSSAAKGQGGRIGEGEMGRVLRELGITKEQAEACVEADRAGVV